MLSDVFPYMVSINRNPPGTATNASSVSFDATFSEAVTGVDAADFSVIATGTVASTSKTVVDSGDHIHFTITVGGVTGGGTLGLNLVDNGTIKDQAGNGIITPNSLAAFGPQSGFTTGNAPQSVATGDVNGDGKLDLVTVNLVPPLGPGSVSALIGNGNGTFSAPQSITLSGDPTAVALGDLNGDGRDDIVVTTSAGTFVLLRNLANTSFAAPVSITTGGTPKSVALGDVNGDGNRDVVVANGGSGSVQVLTGNGLGAFTLADTDTTGTSPSSVALGDVNNDGKLDVVVANQGSNNVRVLIGNGAGAFNLLVATYTTGTSPGSVALGDVDNDGKLDVIVANQGSNNVRVLIGDGAGAFNLLAAINTTGTSPRSVALGDANGDGKLDIAVANSGSGTVGLLQGNGNGTFQAQVTFATGTSPVAVVFRDMNGDGKPDLGVANTTSNNVSVLLNSLTGPFTGQVYTVDNIAPVFTSSAAVNLPENTTSVITVTATDSGAPVTFSKTGGADAAVFTVNSTTGELTIVAQDFETPADSDLNNVYQVQITATDAAGNSSAQTVSVTIVDQNEAPTNILLSNSSIAENLSAGVVVGTFQAIDPDPGNTHTYDLVPGLGGDDNNSFVLNVNGTLTTAEAFDFETKPTYSIRVRATDQGTLSFEKQFTINVTDGPEWSFVGGILTMPGTAQDDLITVSVVNGTIRIVANGTISETGLAPAGVDRVVLSGLGGNDRLTLHASLGSSLPGTLLGGAGNDTLTGGPANDILDGGGDNDTLIGGAGDDALDGGSGNDSYRFITNSALGSDSVTDISGTDQLYFVGSTNAVAVDLSLTTAQTVNANLTLTQDSGTSIERIAGGSGDDTLIGNTLNNLISGNGGNDTLSGGDGNDTLDGGAGNDSISGGIGDDGLTGGADDDEMDGGIGNDSYKFITNSALGSDTVTDISGTDQLYFVGSTNAVAVNLSLTTAQIVNANLTLTLDSNTSMETVYGGSGDDILIGNSLGNALCGNGGNDSLDGGSGDDRYIFNTNSALGSDTVTDISGIDQLYFVTSTDALSLNLGLTTAQIVNANLTLTLNSSTSMEAVYGGSGDDILIGNSLNNLLNGNGGNDILSGDDGNDTLNGGDGKNILIGGNGVDRLTSASGEDILIGARYTLGTDPTALGSLMSEWKSNNEYADRVNHLLGTQPGGANGLFILTSATVKEDSQPDTLIGGSGKDWYFNNSLGANLALRDIFSDSVLDSLFTEISTWL